MSNKISRLALSAILVSAAIFCGPIYSQQPEIRPVTIGQPMPDFTLPSYQSGSMTLSDLQGKNVLLIFPAGFAAEGRWCTIDNYRYAELIDLEKSIEIRKKYNVEIMYVFPYSKEIIKEWIKSNPEQLDKIQTRKNPSEPEKLDEQGKMRVERSRKLFPKDLKMEKGKVPTPFPILLDSEKKVSKGLGIFTTEWGGSKVNQCITSVFIIDKNGALQFKYMGQSTVDRAPFDYMLKTLDRIIKEE